jgi:hypothetical protein
MMVKIVWMKKMLNQFKKVHVGHVNFARTYKTQNTVNMLITGKKLMWIKWAVELVKSAANSLTEKKNY